MVSDATHTHQHTNVLVPKIKYLSRSVVGKRKSPKLCGAPANKFGSKQDKKMELALKQPRPGGWLDEPNSTSS